MNEKMNEEKNQQIQYEKPEMKFVELRSKNEVANTCWGYASNGTGGNLYYNSPGYGWVNFSVSGDDCKNSQSLTYQINGYKDGMTEEQKSAAAAALNSYWYNTAANGGSPFQGSSSDYSEDTPGGGWS